MVLSALRHSATVDLGYTLNMRIAPLAVLVGLGTLACDSALDLDDGALITCGSDQDCPGDWICVDRREQTPVCASSFPDAAPVLTISEFDASRRYLNDVSLALEVFDLNGTIDTPETITVVSEYRIGPAGPAAFDGFDPENPNRAEGWYSGTIEVRLAARETPVESFLLSSDEPRRFFSTWNAVFDAQKEATSRQETLVANDIDATGDGIRDADVVTFLPAVTLRFRAVDSSARASPWVETETFQLGNEPPEARLVGPVAIDEKGRVTLALTLSDSASDPIDLEAAYCLAACDSSDASWAIASLVDNVTLGSEGSSIELGAPSSSAGSCANPTAPRSLTRCILSSPEPRSHLIVWASQNDLNGPPSDEVRFRIRASDAFTALEEGDSLAPRHHGDWDQPPVNLADL